MTDQMTRVIPAGWYDDPKSSDHVRWWNGLGWTEHIEAKPETPVASAEMAAMAPPATPAVATAEQAAQAAAAAEAARAEAEAAEARKPQIGLGFGGGYYAQRYTRDDD